MSVSSFCFVHKLLCRFVLNVWHYIKTYTSKILVIMPEYSISIFLQIIYNLLFQTQFFFHFINFNSLVLSSDSFISFSLHSAEAHMVTAPTIFSVILSNVFMYVVISFEKTHSNKMSVVCKKCQHAEYFQQVCF